VRDQIEMLRNDDASDDMSAAARAAAWDATRDAASAAQEMQLRKMLMQGETP
jgi:hypothetical protein